MKPLRLVTLLFMFLYCNPGSVNAQWVQTGLTSTTVNAFAAIGTNLFAATSDGVYRSTDSGSSWTKANASLDSSGIAYAIPALAASGINLFAGTDHGVFLSSNNGTSWTRVSTGLTSTSVLSLAASPVSGGSGVNLFAGTDLGVFLSTNNGATWSSTSSSYFNYSVRALAVSGSNTFAGTDSGKVYRSNDNGNTWTLINVGWKWPRNLSLAAEGSNIYAGTYGSGVLVTTNGGASWDQKLAAGTNSITYALLADGSNLYAGTNGGIFVSADNGINWSPADSGLTNTSVRCLVLSGSDFFAGTQNGAYRRSSGDFMSLDSPGPAATGLKTPLRFTWNRNAQALTYLFQVSKDINFSNPLDNHYTPDTTYTVTSLDPATTYYWRIRAENTNGATEWALSSFTTSLFNSPPQVISPVNGATLVSVTPTLQWNSLASAATYTVQVSTQENFLTIFFSKDTESTVVVVPELEHFRLYYWRVRAQTPGDTTGWSSLNTFTTVRSAPARIKLVYPDSAKQDALQNDWLIWAADTGATSYHIDLSLSPLFTAIFDSGTVSGVNYRRQTKLFSTGSTYFWRVRGSNVGGGGPFSSVWSFKSGSSQRAPILQPQFSVIQFGKIKVGESRESAVSVTNPGNDTLKVTRMDVSGDGLSTDPKNFVLAPGSSGVLRVHYVPVAGGSLTGTVSLVSNAASSPDVINVSGFGAIYRIRLTPGWIDMGTVPVGGAKNGMFSLVNTGNDTLRVSEISTTLTIPGFSLQRGNMVILSADSTRCELRFAPTIIGAARGIVSVVSNASTSPDSVVLIVEGVPAATGVLPDRGIPDRYSLGQNYPNPFNPSTMIIYAVPQSANVSLKIFNALGQEVAELVNEMKAPGYYRVQWNASVPSGMYFYRLRASQTGGGQAGSFVETRKMILLR